MTIDDSRIKFPSPDREFDNLDDIAVTPNYLQIMRHKLDNDGESFILNIARGMVLAKGAPGA
jgi:hypothetical protein